MTGYPPHHFYGRGFGGWHRGPSRLIWFGLGALFATLWARKHSDARSIREDRRERKLAYEDRMRYEGCASGPMNDSRAYDAPTSPRAPLYENNPADHPYAHWEEDKRRIIEMTARARDTIGDLSDATLDGIMATVTDMKGKLAEHRAERQRDLDLAEKKARERHLV